MLRPCIALALPVVAILVVAYSTIVSDAAGAQQAAPAAADAGSGPATAAFSAKASALPFPPDAREVEFDATFDDIEFTSGSSLASLADFYRREMQRRGWEEDVAAATGDEESVELTFTHDSARVVLEVDQGSSGARVSMDCEGIDFERADDPAALLTAGVPQPRSYLFLQKETPRPEAVQDTEYRSDECHFKSTLALQAAFDFYGKALKALGWQESRRPIITGDRRYTEFKRGTTTLSVNIFAHEVGSRIILGYEDTRKEPVVPPLREVAASPLPKGTDAPQRGGAAPAAPAAPETTAVDVSTNAGAATVTLGAKRYVFKYAAAFQTKEGGDERTSLLFLDRPVPLDRMQSMLATEDSLSIGDMFKVGFPGYLRIELNGYTGFSFSAGGTGIGDSIDDPVSDIKIEDGRVRGTIKMRQPAEYFDDPFNLSATIDAAVLTPNTRLGGVAERPAVTARESPFPDSELTLPDDAYDVLSEGTQYRKSTRATVELGFEAIADFYRKELAAQGWKEDEAARVWQVGGGESAPHATLVFHSAGGLMTVALERGEQGTLINVAMQDHAKAKRDGVLPETGKARLIMGNAHTSGVVITIGNRDYPLKAGQGAKNPRTALNYSVPPGKYVVTIKIPGEAPQTETLDITSGTSWGVLALPTGGYMANRLY